MTFPAALLLMAAIVFGYAAWALEAPLAAVLCVIYVLAGIDCAWHEVSMRLVRAREVRGE